MAHVTCTFLRFRFQFETLTSWDPWQSMRPSGFVRWELWDFGRSLCESEPRVPPATGFYGARTCVLLRSGAAAQVFSAAKDAKRLGGWGQVHFLPYLPLHFLVLRLVSVVSSEPFQVHSSIFIRFPVPLPGQRSHPFFVSFLSSWRMIRPQASSFKRLDVAVGSLTHTGCLNVQTEREDTKRNFSPFGSEIFSSIFSDGTNFFDGYSSWNEVWFITRSLEKVWVPAELPAHGFLMFFCITDLQTAIETWQLHWGFIRKFDPRWRIGQAQTTDFCSSFFFLASLNCVVSSLILCWVVPRVVGWRILKSHFDLVSCHRML